MQVLRLPYLYVLVAPVEVSGIILLFWLFVLLTSKPCKSTVVSDHLRTFYLVKTETEHHAADYALCLGKSVVHIFQGSRFKVKVV